MKPTMVVPGISGDDAKVEAPRRGLAWRLVRFWLAEHQAGVDMSAINALIVQVLVTGRSPGDGSLRDAGDEALDDLIGQGWTPTRLAATATAFASQVAKLYPSVKETADFSKAQGGATIST